MGSVIHLERSSGNGNGGSGTGWKGQVEFRADLPITIGTPAIGEVYLVEKPTTVGVGILSYTTYQSGLYIKEADTGALSDWRRLNVKVQFTDGEFAIVSAADTSIKARHDLSLLTQSQVYNWPNKSGTVALLSDITGGLPVGLNNQVLFSNGDGTYTFDYRRTVFRSFRVADNENAQSINNSEFFGFSDILEAGYYDTVAVVFAQVNLGPTDSRTFRVKVWDYNTNQVITQGSIVLNNTNEEEFNFPLETPIDTRAPVRINIALGVNDGTGGGNIQHFRRFGNQVNDDRFIFQFQQQNGYPPDDFSTINKNPNNNEFQIALFAVAP